MGTRPVVRVNINHFSEDMQFRLLSIAKRYHLGHLKEDFIICYQSDLTEFMKMNKVIVPYKPKRGEVW